MNASKPTTMAVLLGVVLATTGFSLAGTTVGGFISTDEHWTAAASPYLVDESIAVIAGATLTIDPGVEVRFEPDLALVVDTGGLVAQGTAGSPIRFTANQGGGNPWAYLQFSDGAVNAAFDANGVYLSGSILEHTIVEYAGSTSTLGAVRAIGSSPYIHSVGVWENAKGGLYISGAGASSIRVEDSNFSTNTGLGLSVYSTSSAKVKRNTVRDNTSRGVYFNNSGLATVSNNTIEDNAGGLQLDSSSGGILTNNTISGNSGTSSGSGLYLSGSSGCTLSNNTITDNAGSTGAGLYLWYSTSLTLTNNTLSGNTASGSGGGIYLYSSPSMELSENVITGNTAGQQGGAIYASNSDNVTLLADRITDNHSDLVDGVGGIFLYNSSDGWDLTGANDLGLAQSVHIYGNDNYQFYNNNAFGGSFGYGDPGNADARYVYWGTADSNAIEVGVYDFFDDASKGVVFYEPFAVPEPATLAMLAFGALVPMLSGLKRRRKS